MRKSLIQLKREFWECRASFIRTPLIMAGVLMALLLLGVVPLQGKIGKVFEQAQLHQGGALHAEQEAADGWPQMEGIGASPEYLVHGLAAVYSVFALVLILVLVFYFVDTLYSDRRDQSILFWKSLPLAEHRNVLTKLAAGVAGAPVFYAIAATVTGAFFLVVFLVYAGVFWNIPVPSIGTVVAVFLKSTVGLVLGWWFLVLWLLPLFCWLMFSSSVAKKAPFLIALGLPIGLMVLEAWVFGSGHVAGVIGDQVVAAFYSFQTLVHHPQTVLEQLANSFSSLQLWVGIVLSAGFLATSVWLRVNHWEV